MLSYLEELLKLVLSQITLAVVDEPQNLEKLEKSKTTQISKPNLLQLYTLHVAKVDEGALVRVLQQDVSEERTCRAEDRLVRLDLLVVSGGQGDIGKVVVRPEAS